MKENYSSNDFYSSALLRASGIPIKNIIKLKEKFCSFHFDASPEECEEILARHWDRTLVLPTRDVIDAINELKTRVYSI